MSSIIQALKAASSKPVYQFDRQIFKVMASVAMIFKNEVQPEVLMIRRAIDERDPWSGQMGFPGGRHEEADPCLRETAKRETHEEIGLKLEDDHFLGRLDEVQGRHAKESRMNFFIAPHLFWLPKEQDLLLDASEVASTHWIPLSHLQDSSNHEFFEYQGMRLPRIDFSPVPIWGLSYMMLADLFQRIEKNDLWLTKRP